MHSHVRCELQQDPRALPEEGSQKDLLSTDWPTFAGNNKAPTDGPIPLFHGTAGDVRPAAT